MDILKKPYEISLWRDVITFVYEDGATSSETMIGEHGAVVAQYYKEEKICTIGSNTMDTQIRAMKPKLVSQVNGSNILTFDLYSHYYNEDTESLESNPFIKLLVNERKVKLNYDSKWYDFVIKKIEENSEEKTYTYTAKDLFINELSKSGFDLEFDTELENNMGTIEELAEKILAESDWKLKEGASSLLRQTIEEPLYEVVLKNHLTAYDMIDSSKTIELKPDDRILVFYNCITNETSYLQFLLPAENYEIDDDYVIISDSNWYIDGVTYEDGMPSIAIGMEFYKKYRGNRLVRKGYTKYDASIDKYVNVYFEGTGKDQKEVYGFMETEYNSPAMVQNFITNGNNFTSDIGWEVGGVSSGSGTIYPQLTVTSVPNIKDITAKDFSNNSEILESYIKVKFTANNQVLYNSGAIDHRQQINGFSQNDSYVFRIKYGEADEKTANGAKTLKASSISLRILVAKYELADGVYDFKDIYFDSIISPSAAFDFNYVTSICKKSLSYVEMVEMSSSLGIFIVPQGSSSNKEIYIEEFQFFKYVPVQGENDATKRPLLPDEVWTESQVVNTYYYYYPGDYESIDEVNFIYKGTEPNEQLTQQYNQKYEKIRSIKASESNRFNLLQDLCEIFECWVRFEIDHFDNGEIKLDENYRQKKWVSFHEFIGKENYSGFKYGINLKAIKRDIDSETIVSKVVVKNNSNEFAEDGFCSIARALENPSGENFILDFSYYIQQGLLGFSELNNDLYLDINGWLGYYKHLKRINQLRDLYIKEQSSLFTDLADYKANCKTYDTLLAETEEQLREQNIYIKAMTSFTFEQLLNNKNSTWWSNEEVVRVMASIGHLKTIKAKYEIYSKNAKENLDGAQARYDELTRILTSREEPTEEQSGERRLLLEKEELNKKFYQKYSRFLQEGSWISEDYIDDELYYLDAYGTAHTSAQPQVSYTISVLELSQIEEYQNYSFALGDKTTIEDTEFFGWTFSDDGVQTPYKEEIVVTELTIELDSPESNEIKVQNYKTQFEDLFQRMAATTQSVEYNTGQYTKVSNIINSDGTISASVLQYSLDNNSFIISNSTDQSVTWDETGITSTSLKNPNEIVKIVSGGIFLSTDGGINWYTGITAKGINANYITAGQIDASRINIYNGNFSSFRWDGDGLSAFQFSTNQNTGEVENYNYGKFVRFDQYGIYGIDTTESFKPNIETDGKKGEDKIWENAKFALTWRGFMLKNDDGSVRISSKDDIQILSGDQERIKIGRLDFYNDEYLYGIRISNAEGLSVMETDSNGELWLRNRLRIGTEDTSTVEIGYLDATRKGTNVHEVIHAGDQDQNFIVYEDGKLIAKGVEIHGYIYATGGQIGGLTVDQIASGGKSYQVLITSSTGNIFKEGKETEKILVAHLYSGAEEIFEGLTYQWKKNEEIIAGETNRELRVLINQLDPQTESATYSCVIDYDAAS